MKAQVKSLSLALIMLHPIYAFAAEEFAQPNFKDLMTPEQYKAAGIDKLTVTERAALITWLREYTGKNSVATAVEPAAVEPAAVEPAAVEPASVLSTPAAIAATPEQELATADAASKAPDKNWGFSNPPEEESEEAALLIANIKGDFRGWSGKNVFRLDNGQIWRQRSSGRFYYTGEARQVEIGQNSWGFFEMRLIEADRSVGVTRVK